MRIVIVGAAIAVTILWFGPFSVPGWAVVAFVVIIFPAAIAASTKQKRMENRLARTLWKALTRKSRFS
jgi:FtsH-binding integral membrane protein